MKKQDEVALESLYESYRERLVEYIDALIDNSVDAEELAQDVFGELADAMARNDPILRGGLAEAMYVIANSCCKRYLLDSDHLFYCELREESSYRTSADLDELQKSDANENAEEILRFLYGEERELARMYFVELMTPKEIARAMGIKVKTYYKKKERAVKNLRWYGFHQMLV